MEENNQTQGNIALGFVLLKDANFDWPRFRHNLKEDWGITFDDEIKDGLAEKLKEFRRCMEEGDFDIGPMSAEEEKERCKYCKYGAICGKIVTEDEEE